MATRQSDSIPASKAAEPAKTPARRTARQGKPETKSVAAIQNVTEEIRYAMIAEAAYYHAERRGFAPGNETQDWLRAEAEIDALLRAAHRGRPQ